MTTIPAHALIHSDLVVLNGIAFPIRSIHRTETFVTLTLVGLAFDFSTLFRHHSLINVRPKH